MVLYYVKYFFRLFSKLEVIMNMVDRVKAICEERGIPISKLEQDLGFSNAYIAQLRKGVFPSDRLLAIADYLDVPYRFLVTGENEKSPGLSTEAMRIAKDYDDLDTWGQRTVRAVTDSELERLKGEAPPVVRLMKTIPLVSNRFAAGPGEPDFGNGLEEYDVPADSDADFAIRITGDSMEPYLPDGSVQLCRKGRPKDGEIGAFLVDGSFYVKQVCIDITGTLHLFSLNRDRRDMDLHLPKAEEHQVLCFGTILKKKYRLPLD